MQHSTPHTFSTGLHLAVEQSLRDVGIDVLTCRSTTLIEGFDTTGARFVFSITAADDVDLGREIRTELVTMFTPAGAL